MVVLDRFFCLHYRYNRELKLQMTHSVLPPMPKLFSAEIIRSDGIYNKIWTDGFRKRVEFYNENGLQSILISRPDKGISWNFLMPDCKVVQELPLSREVMESIFDPTTLLEWTSDGIELIDGHECLRFIGHYNFLGVPVGEAYELAYIDRASSMYRRKIIYNKKGKQSLIIDYRSVILEAPDLSVFELPEGTLVEKL